MTQHTVYLQDNTPLTFHFGVLESVLCFKDTVIRLTMPNSTFKDVRLCLDLGCMLHLSFESSFV